MRRTTISDEYTFPTDCLEDAAQFVYDKFKVDYMHFLGASLDGRPFGMFAVLTGFGNFEQAAVTAMKFGLNIVRLEKRAGAQCWKAIGKTCESLNDMEEYRGEIIESWQKDDDTMADVVQGIEETLSDYDETQCDEALDWITYYAELAKTFATLDDGQWLAKLESGDIETFTGECMDCNNGDGTSYIIGITDYEF